MVIGSVIVAISIAVGANNAGKSKALVPAWLITICSGGDKRQPFVGAS